MIATEIAITPPTFPARPMKASGTVAELMKLPGQWAFEPKYNGHRALVHVPSGAMFNRNGGRLAIAHEFEEALELLTAVYDLQAGLQWLDCEVLNRRTTRGAGTLIVLDAPEIPMPYRSRRALLEEVFIVAPLEPATFPTASVLIPQRWADASNLWNTLQHFNDGADSAHWFYEGIVAKKVDSNYPIQLRSPDDEFLGWLKLRWAW